MYRILYNESTIFDPYGNENEVVTDASMSVEINAAAYLDFTMSRLHPLYDTIAERDGVVTLYWDRKILFQGVIESIDMDIQGNKSISCVSALDYLNDTVVRPYSTIAGEQELTAPSSVDGYFQWLIDQHNDHVLDSGKLFDVGVNQGANLQQNNFIYRSSTSNPTTASEITDQLLDSLGGYLTMRYVDDRRVLDLYSDIHTMNAQIIDFGVNITDFSKTIDTKDQYTALLLKGGSPEFLGGDFENGDFDYWVSHPNTPIATGTVHGGTYSSFFTEGNGEYVNSSFFYAKKGARYKSTVWIKNERSSTIKAYPRYQVYEAGEWVGKTIDGGYDVPNDGEWHEYSFDFMPNLEDYVRIRPRWVFDTVSNDGNKRVYVDDFDFRRVEGGTDVAEDPISVSMVPDGGMQYDANILKTGDVIYDPTAVARYGYKEKVYEDSTITDVDDLLQAGVKELNKLKDPQIGLDIKAVDLALFMDGYDHLNVGDAVRVRSAIHDTDEFLMVTSITLDLQDPGQSEYNIGKAYDSLTGQQSGFLRSLNSGINSSLDAVASLDQTTKDQAIQLGAVENVANQAKDTANNAQNTANNAQQTANSNKEAIDSIKDAQTEYEKQLEQMQQGVADAEQEIGQINDRIEDMNSEIESAKSDIDSLRSSTETELQNVKQSVSKVQSDVDAVEQKASDLASDLDGTKATVEQVTTDLGEVKTTVSNAATKADQALQVSTSASQTATEAKTTATSAYQDAQSAITQSSQATQTANQVSLDLRTNYQTKADADAKYATQASLTATSEQIRTEVSETYATQATVNALENLANNAVQTWMGDGVPTLSNKPASDWTTSELRKQHSGDLYYDTDTGYSYRFGSNDGTNYSWALVKDTDITKALADAAKAQETAEGAQSGVNELKTSIPVTYATKSELSQKADSIAARVEEVAQAGETTSSKVAELELTADGLQTTVTEQAEKLDGAVTTISQVSQRVDSVSSTITQVQGDVASVNSAIMIQNPGFETGDLTGWTADNWIDPTAEKMAADQNGIGTYRFRGAAIQGTGNYSYLRSKAIFGAIPGKTYRVSVAALYADSNTTAIMMLQRISDQSRPQITKSIGPNWTSFSGELTVPSNWSIGDDIRFEFAVQGIASGQNRILADDFSIVDISDAKTAQSTANSALSQSSTVKQELTSFKTNVQQTYETKNDALSKQSSLQQSVNNLRTEVSEQYTTKSEFNDLTIGGTNRALLTATAKTMSGTATANQCVDIYSMPDDGYALFGTDPVMLSYDVTASGSSLSGIYRIQGNGDPGWTFATGTKTRNLADIGNGKTLHVEDQVAFGSGSENHFTAFQVRMDNATGTLTFSNFKIEKGTKPTTWSPAPEDMLSKADAATTYSTKSYVDQTARTVSLGVVEEYKSGKHGSALATQSDITATKNSITQTVSQTYLSKTDATNTYLNKNTAASTYATKTEVKHTSDSLTVTISSAMSKAESAQNTANAAKKQTYNTVEASSGTAGYFRFATLKINHAYTNRPIYFSLSNRGQKASNVWVQFNNVNSKDPTLNYIQADGGMNVWIHKTATSTWEMIAQKSEGYDTLYVNDYANNNNIAVTWVNAFLSSVPSGSTQATRLASKRPSSDIDNAQHTANTANSNAQNAQNRVGNLETCIKMTSDGVRVGKISNGNFTGYSALVNSAGSFDILDSSSKTLAFFNKNGLSIKSTSDRGMFVGFDSAANSGYIGSTPKVVTSEGGRAMDIGMAMSFDSGGYLNIINNLGGIGIAGNGISLIATGSDRVKIGVMDVRGAGVVLFDRDDGNNYNVVNITIGYNFSEFNYIMCFFKTNDGQYFGGTAYHPNGKEYCFTTMGGGGTDMSYLKGTRWYFNGTRAERKTTFEIGPGYSTTVNDAVMHIVAIIGFDYYKTSG